MASSQHGACGLTILPIAQHDGLIRADFSKGARTVQENVIVSHRGARYEIGRGHGFYGIWPAGPAGFQPIEWWPETAEGWNGAWSRFSEIESRRAIRPVGQSGGSGEPPSPDLPAGQARRAIVASALLAIGVAVGIAGLFPDYIGGGSLAQHSILLSGPPAPSLSPWAEPAGKPERSWRPGPALSRSAYSWPMPARPSPVACPWPPGSCSA